MDRYITELCGVLPDGTEHKITEFDTPDVASGLDLTGQCIRSIDEGRHVTYFKGEFTHYNITQERR